MLWPGILPRQAYNAQSAVNEKQVILAAEISIAAPDFGHLAPMLETTLNELREQGASEMPEVVLADAGYWHTAQMQASPNKGSRCSSRPTETCAKANAPAGTTAYINRCATR